MSFFERARTLASLGKMKRMADADCLKLLSCTRVFLMVLLCRHMCICIYVYYIVGRVNSAWK